MPNVFDVLKATAFKEVTKVMGFTARWLSGTDGTIITAAHGVNFKYPSLKEKQFIEYDDAFWAPENKVMEYFETDWPGLFDSINRAEVVEKFHLVPQNPTLQEAAGVYYRAGSARRQFDGDLIYVQLFLAEDIEAE